MSRHKDDLVHIKDMYRLLRFKGNIKLIVFEKITHEYYDRLSIP